VSRYETSIPHVAFGIAAVAITAITFGVSVVMPAKMESDNLEPRMVAASKVTTPAVTGVITDPASIDVAVQREPGLSAVPYAVSQRNLNPEGGVRRSARPGMRRGEGSEIRDPICRIARYVVVVHASGAAGAKRRCGNGRNQPRESRRYN
jgi:hypothetical protein